MSTEITTAFVQQYRDTVMHLVQQKGSVLRPFVRVTSGLVGKRSYFDQIGKVEPVAVTTRHRDSPLVSTPHRRRAMDLTDWELGDMVDSIDKVRLLIDPGSSYVQAQAMGFGRQIDRKLIDAMRDSALTGETGATSTALPSTQKVAVDYVESGVAANSSLTIAKLRRAKEIMDANEVPADDRHIAIGSHELNKLLQDSLIQSIDTNIVRALVDGVISKYMGFQFHNTELLETSGTSRFILAWHRDGVQLGFGLEPRARIAERADKAFGMYYFMEMTLGTTRLEEERVVEIACHTTA